MNRLIGPTFEDVDCKRAVDLLSVPSDEARKFTKDLMVMEPGNFWAFGRAISKERILTKIGEVETTHPEAGSFKHAMDAPPAPAKIQSLLPKLSDLPKEAEQKAKTEADLRKEITDLKRQLSARPTITVPETKVERVEVPILAEGDIRIIRDDLRTASESLNSVNKLIGDIVAIHQSKPAPRFTKPTVFNSSDVTIHTPGLVTFKQKAISQDGEPKIGPGERKTLTACGQYPDGVTRENLTIITGYKRSTRDKHIQILQSAGLVVVRGNAIFISDHGFETLGPDFEPLPMGDDLRKFWAHKLTGGEQKIFQLACEWYPTELERDFISEQTGLKRSTRDKYLQFLAARRLVVSTAPSLVRANEAGCVPVHGSWPTEEDIRLARQKLAWLKHDEW